MLLVFDTETTGKWDFRGTIGERHQPRLVQLAAILVQNTGNISINYIIKPNGFTIPDEVAKIHGITNERAMEEGVPIEAVLKHFNLLAFQADEDKDGWLIAHNFNFDFNILMNEHYLRREDSSYLGLLKPYCTMRAATKHCRLPNPNPRFSAYKWPTLQEAYRHFYGKDFKGAHDALNDVNACLAVYHAIQKAESV